MKTKRETKDFGTGTCALRGVGKRKSFCTLKTPITGGVGGSFKTSEGRKTVNIQKAKQREVTTEIG